MNIPGEVPLTLKQMDDMIVGAACMLNVAVGYENTILDPTRAREFHERVTADCIFDLGYCLWDRFSEGDGAWSAELAAENYPVQWWRRALELGFIPLILRERKGYPPLSDNESLLAYARHEHFAYTDLVQCRQCQAYTIHRVTEYAGRCVTCGTLRPPPDHDIIIMNPMEG